MEVFNRLKLSISHHCDSCTLRTGNFQQNVLTASARCISACRVPGQMQLLWKDEGFMFAYVHVHATLRKNLQFFFFFFLTGSEGTGNLQQLPRISESVVLSGFVCWSVILHLETVYFFTVGIRGYVCYCHLVGRDQITLLSIPQCPGPPTTAKKCSAQGISSAGVKKLVLQNQGSQKGLEKTEFWKLERLHFR